MHYGPYQHLICRESSAHLQQANTSKKDFHSCISKVEKWQLPAYSIGWGEDHIKKQHVKALCASPWPDDLHALQAAWVKAGAAQHQSRFPPRAPCGSMFWTGEDLTFQNLQDDTTLIIRESKTLQLSTRRIRRQREETQRSMEALSHSEGSHGSTLRLYQDGT